MKSSSNFPPVSFSFIFYLLTFLFNSQAVSQTIIKEKVKINPPKSLLTINQSVQEDPALQFQIGAPIAIHVEVFGPDSSSAAGDASGGMNPYVLLTLPAVNGLYQIKVSATIGAGGRINIDPTIIWNNGGIPLGERWLYNGGTETAVVSTIIDYYFNGITPQIPFEFWIEIEEDYICGNKSSGIFIYASRDINTLANKNVFLELNDMDTDAVLFKIENEEVVGTTLSTELDRVWEYGIKLNSPYNGEDKEIKLKAYSNGIEKKDSVYILPAGNYYFLEAEEDRIEMVHGMSIPLSVQLTTWDECTDIRLMDTLKYMIEITSGDSPGHLKHPATGVLGKSFSNLSHSNGVLTFDFIADGSITSDKDTTYVLVSTTNPDIWPYEFMVIVNDARLIVLFDPERIMPGDTASVVLKKKEPDGSIVDFEEDQRFDFKLIAGGDYGDIYIPQWEEITDESWYVEQGFKFIASTDITNLPVESVLLVNTSGGFAGSKLPMDENVKEEQTRINRIEAKQTIQRQNRNIDEINKTSEGAINKSIMIGGPEEQLWGIGTVTIGENLNTFYIKAAFDKGLIAPDDTVNVVVKKVDKDGNESEFTPGTLYEVGIKEGCDIGNILISSGQLGQYFFNVTRPIRFIVNDSLATDSANVVLRIGVHQDNDTIYLPYSSFVQSQSHKSQPVELLQTKIGENRSAMSMTSDYCITNPFEYKAYGLAVGMVKPDDCSNANPCDAPPKAPNFTVMDHPNGYLGYDICESESSNRVGGFHPLLDNFESAFEPYALNLCYNSSTDRWQITPHENTISIRAIVSTCYNVTGIQRELIDVSEINNIPEDELCEAIVSINKHLRYPIAVTPNIHFYWLREVIYAHELEHLAVFRDSTMKIAMSKEINLDDRKFPSFREAITYFDISCKENNNYLDVLNEAYRFYEKTLSKLLIKIYDVHEVVKNQTNETKFHSRSNIQDTVNKYATGINNRLKILKINCGAN
ncbi:MAG: hypothetical protein RDU14_05120 [Melioribacteraceae bacterium]|nr:hypothetical protein [Melioribacteraceae bacterium]